LTTFDADRGTEKESNQHILLSATDVRDAYDKVSQHMNQLGVGYVIPSIAFQKIIEVFPQDEWQVVDGQEQPKDADQAPVDAEVDTEDASFEADAV
jgi:hypothetical protein